MAEEKHIDESRKRGDGIESVESSAVEYGEANIIHLDDMEHIRRRPGMYIGKLGDGSHSDDGIYVLIKESIDNSIDEYRMGEGKVIEVDIVESQKSKVESQTSNVERLVQMACGTTDEVSLWANWWRLSRCSTPAANTTARRLRNPSV